MATVNNNFNQATEHHLNTGVTLLNVKWNFTIDASEHTTGQALSVIESISGALRANGYTGKIRHITLRNTNSTPAAKACAIYFMSRVSIPATPPAQSSDVVMIDTDAPYVLGRVDFASADWKTLDDVAIQTKTNVDIPIINEDSTVGTSIYAFLVHTDSTHTFSSSQKIYVDLWIEQY